MTRSNRLQEFFTAIVLLALVLPQGAAKAQAWLELFGQPTITGAIRSIARDGSKLYVSGRLLSVADQRVRGLATFDAVTRAWSPVNVDIGDGFSYMASYGDGNERALYGAGLPDHTVVKIQNGQIVSMDIEGFVSGMQSVLLRGRQVLVASGSFQREESVFGLAIWNGESWRYLAELTPSTRHLTILNRNGKTVIYALKSGENVVMEYDGFELVYRQVPLLPNVSGISHISGRLVACDQSGVTLIIFDGLVWSLLPVPNRVDCRNLTPRRFEGRDQLIYRDIIGSWSVYDAGIGSPSPLQMPAGNDRFTRPIAAAGETALVTLSARQSSRQLAIWGSNGWEQPEQDFQSSRQRTQLRSAYSLNGRTYVFGQFGQASDPLQSAVAIFGDEGISNVTMVPELSSSAVMDESGKAYAWTPDGLWVNPGEEPVVLNVSGASAGAALALTDAGELFIGTCGQQLLRLQGGILPVAAELPDDLEILCDVPLVVIHESSPATGIYFMAAQPQFVFENGRRVSVWRFDGVELSEVSPAELTGFVASQTYPTQVSPITIGGEVFPALAFGSRLTWFDGQQWTSFPLIPGELLSNGDVSGPVASAKIGNDECVFATLRTQIIQFCNNQWSTSDTLAFSFMNTIDLIFQRGIQTLFASDYQERPVLLVGGSFDGAGDSTQSRSAVLDLDVIYRNGLEF